MIKTPNPTTLLDTISIENLTLDVGAQNIVICVGTFLSDIK